MTARLKIILDSFSGCEFPIGKKETIIGRELSNEIVINNIEVSRRHARITIDEKGEYFIEDLNSTNGTFLNGKILKSKQMIKSGDDLRLGNSIYLKIISSAKLSESNNTESEKKQKVMEMESADNTSHLEKKLPVKSNSTEMIESSDLKWVGEKNKNTFYKLKLFLYKLPPWASIVIIALFFLIIFFLIPLIIIEITNQWCHLFQGFFNSIKPGICP